MTDSYSCNTCGASLAHWRRQCSACNEIDKEVEANTWRKDQACLKTGRNYRDYFFPERGAPTRHVPPSAEFMARKYCTGCPVTKECAAAAEVPGLAGGKWYDYGTDGVLKPVRYLLKQDKFPTIEDALRRVAGRLAEELETTAAPDAAGMSKDDLTEDDVKRLDWAVDTSIRRLRRWAQKKGSQR